MHREEEEKKRREEIKKVVRDKKIDYKIIFKGDIFWEILLLKHYQNMNI